MPILHPIERGISITSILSHLKSPLGYAILFGLTILFALIIPLLGLKYSIILMIGVLTLPALVICFFNFQFGMAITLVMAMVAQYIPKLISFPAGIALDALVFFMFIGLIVRQIQSRDWSFAYSPISGMILIWIFYCLLQVLNPSAGSRLAWVFTVRSLAGLIFLYFVALFAFRDLKRIKGMIKFMIILAVVSSAYGLKQEWFGFSNAEMAWLYADAERFQLIFQWSRLRIFSFFSDPTSYGVYMGYMAVFCIVLIFGPIKVWQKIMLGIFVAMMMLSMMYAGSRTPFVLVPVGFIFYAIATFKKEVVMAGMAVVILAVPVVIKGSASNAVLFRLRSAFQSDLSKDTMDVRSVNRKRVQPHVWNHPIGHGMGSTGIWGKRFTPGTWLASFAHDSGYVRIMVEMGWIGLIIYMAFLMTVMKTGIYYYMRVKDPEIKTYYAAILTVLFMLVVANYPQEAIVLLPTSIIFYIMLAMLVRLKDYDPNFNPEIAAALEEQEIYEAETISESNVPEKRNNEYYF